MLRWLGGLDFSVSPSPFGTNWVFELIGTWLGQHLGFLGLGLDNNVTYLFYHLHESQSSGSIETEHL